MSQRGQASVELVALLPLAVVVAAAAFHVLAAGAASEAAAAAAEAGAVALLQDRDPAAATRRALDGWPPRSYRIRVRGGRVSVELAPRGIPALARRLAAHATADAGSLPAARPPSARPVRGGDGLGAEPERARP